VVATLVKKSKNSVLKGMAAFYYPAMFLEKYPHNKYAQAILEKQAVPAKSTPSTCTREVGGGLSITDIKRAAKRPADVVLFDWDLTLSVCNGIPLPKNTTDYTFTEVAQYCAGTMERFHALREMFAELRLRGTKVFILTNSGFAKSYGNDFVEILKVLDSELTKEDVVLGKGFKAKTFKTDKRLRPIFAANRKTQKK
jgi:hypothetical protein